MKAKTECNLCKSTYEIRPFKEGYICESCLTYLKQKYEKTHEARCSEHSSPR